MRIDWPTEPSGTGRSANWLRKLLRACKQNEIIPGPDHRIKPQGNGGFILENIARASGAGGADARLTFRGSFDPVGTVYQRGDIVQTSYLDPTGLDGPQHFWIWWSDLQPTGNPDTEWVSAGQPLSSSIEMGENFGWILLARIPWILSSPSVNGVDTPDRLPPTVAVEVTTPTGTKTLSFAEGVLFSVT